MRMIHSLLKIFAVVGLGFTLVACSPHKKEASPVVATPKVEQVVPKVSLDSLDKRVTAIEARNARIDKLVARNHARERTVQ